MLPTRVATRLAINRPILMFKVHLKYTNIYYVQSHIYTLMYTLIDLCMFKSRGGGGGGEARMIS